MKKTTIEFEGRGYPLRTIIHPEFGEVNIGSIGLTDLLVIDGRYTSLEAQKIDEQIFFFVENGGLKLPDEGLIELINVSI